MTKREDNLKAVVTRYIGILNSQNLLSLDKVAELIVSMLKDLESTINDDVGEIVEELAMLKARTILVEDKLRGIEGDVLGQVVRYVIGESLAKPGGLPADIDRLVQSSHKVERGISNLSSELVHLIDRVDRLERTEKGRHEKLDRDRSEQTEKESIGKLYLRRFPIYFLIITLGIIVAILLML